MIGAKGGMQNLVALLSGVVFAIGLALSGMTLPVKVQGFLDVTGNWDPTLAFVMGGAVIVYAGFYFLLSKKRTKPVFGVEFNLPTKTKLDWRLFTGSAMFGIGWGISGLCPGPALVSIATGITDLMIFLCAVALGMFLFRGFARPKS